MTQTGLKGELRELKDIEPGTPVEIVDTAEFTYRGPDATQPVIGILTQNATSIYDVTKLAPRVNVLDPAGKWVRADAKAAYGISQTAKVLKVLTGLKGQALLRQARENISATVEMGMSKAVSFCSGTDPEIFVVGGDGKLIPAWKFLPSKQENSAAFWDGFQAEFTVQADYCACYVMDYMRDGLKRVWAAAKKVDLKAQLSLDSVVEIDPAELEAAAEEHVALGCSPSKNAYGLKGLKPPDCRMLRHRFAGGHIHLGATLPKDVSPWVRAIDTIAGVASVGMFAGYENPVRRKFYGLPGEHRLPKHGLEYRTLPNTWLSHPAVAIFMFDLVRACVWAQMAGLVAYWDVPQDEVIRVIVESDVNAARKIIAHNGKFFHALMKWVSEHGGIAGATHAGAPPKDPEKYATAATKLVMEGIDAVVARPRDLVGNWMLDRPGTGNYYSTTEWSSHCESKDKQWYQAAHTICAGGKIE